MDPDLHKVCPECASEYRLDALRCADCDVPLVSPEEVARRMAREIPPMPGLHAVRTAPITWVRALAADLEAQGIRYGIDRRRARSERLLTLLVRRQDREAAAVVDAARARIEAPLYREEEELAGEAEEPSNVMPFPREAVDHKVCPRCGGEYRLEIDACADCGIPLVFPGEAPAEAAREETPQEENDDVSLFTGPGFELPPSDDLVCVCCRSPRALRHLSRQLDAASIAHRIDAAPYDRSIEIGCLYVQPADGDAAAAVDALEFGGTPIEEADLAELATCPACGAEYPPGALECSGCGLRTGADTVGLDRTCERCGAVVGQSSRDRCPNCAARLPA
jgi:ribosomal protein L37E